MTKQEQRENDERIRQYVLEELNWDTCVDEDGLVVEVTEGVVRLRGNVPHFAAQMAAEEAARRIAGVARVESGIRVQDPPHARLTDPEIAWRVRELLYNDPTLSPEGIDCSVARGWVTLKGEVGTWSKRQHAHAAAVFVPGVRGVVNRIRVAAPVVAADRLRSSILEALERYGVGDPEDLEVVVDHGEVTLAGSVRAWPLRWAIVGAAGHARGVRRVVDLVRVKRADKGGKTPTRVTPTSREKSRKESGAGRGGKTTHRGRPQQREVVRKVGLGSGYTPVAGDPS
ncbi:MAG: BON domain-containing protein [Planctomycetota bacterium]